MSTEFCGLLFTRPCVCSVFGCFCGHFWPFGLLETKHTFHTLAGLFAYIQYVKNKKCMCVCMYLCMCIYIYIYKHAYICICIFYIGLYLFIYIYMYINTFFDLPTICAPVFGMLSFQYGWYTTKK